MGMQMYMVALRGGFSDDASAAVQRFIRQRGGFILMVTRTGPLVALEDNQAPAVAKHPLVDSIGPVMLNPHGIAADRLQRIFAENLGKQINLDGLDHSDSKPQ